MSAVMTRRRRIPARDRDLRQTSLFSQLVSPPPVAPSDERATERHAPTASTAVDPHSPTAATAVDPNSPTATAVDPHSPAAAAPAADAVASFDATTYADAELSLEDAITALWDDLTAGEVSDCPVCGEAMEPRHSAGAGVVGGRCTSCATTIV
jgi:hypothetical protein